MKIYLSSHTKAAPEVRAIGGILRAAGHVIVSTWHEPSTQGLPDRTGEEYTIRARQLAQHALREILDSDALIVLSIGCGHTHGGMWFEQGFAFGANVDCYMVGPKINVFSHLPSIKCFETVEELMADLKARGSFGFKPTPYVEARA